MAMILTMGMGKDTRAVIREGHVVLIYMRYDEPGVNGRNNEPQYRQQLSVVHFQCAEKIMLVAIDIFGNFIPERTFVCKLEDIIVEGEPDTSSKKKFYIKALTKKGQILTIEDVLDVTTNITERVKKIQNREPVMEISKNEEISVKKRVFFRHLKGLLGVSAISSLIGVVIGLLIAQYL